MHLMHEIPVEQGMDTGLLHEKYNVFERNLQASSAPEDVRTSSASKERSSVAEYLRDLRLLKIYEIDTILADGVDHLGMLGFRLRRLSSIRFERCTPSLFSSVDLRLHRTFV
ncbi:hypothetical protein L6452_37203 [Arctium lappa]|uniref:Uncharacterized protein n=1 Tax=Arctium lappa TaxID=4217 RepID=A0ACB8Y3H2_ARCLA|nr:hypothetical protein L6452_37203 [Arctium lappa]